MCNIYSTVLCLVIATTSEFMNHLSPKVIIKVRAKIRALISRNISATVLYLIIAMTSEFMYEGVHTGVKVATTTAATATTT